jgi:2-polyprenyl-3-methyl-5-hydroxy-6-metoxy-1,4-benzoquinol methylase
MVDLDWNGMWMEAMNEATWMKGCKDLNPRTARKRAEQYNKDALLREIRNNQVGKLVSKLGIRPGSTIMDMGAGPGTLAIPLSKSPVA